ncbi:hypothetical protein LINPERHAP2_LOCUS30943, partial [Linum perenne]
NSVCSYQLLEFIMAEFHDKLDQLNAPAVLLMLNNLESSDMSITSACGIVVLYVLSVTTLNAIGINVKIYAVATKLVPGAEMMIHGGAGAGWVRESH